MAPAQEPERRELVLSCLSPERRTLVMDLLLSSGAKYTKDEGGSYTATLQMDLSPEDVSSSVQQQKRWSSLEKDTNGRQLQLLVDTRASLDQNFQTSIHEEAPVASTSGRYLSAQAEESYFELLATRLDGPATAKSQKLRQHLEKLWGQSSSHMKVGSKVLTRWSNAEARERTGDLPADLVAETAEHFHEVCAALTQPRSPVKRKPLNWIIKVSS
jgi:hypothetical protein